MIFSEPKITRKDTHKTRKPHFPNWTQKSTFRKNFRDFFGKNQSNEKRTFSSKTTIFQPEIRYESGRVL